jgi:hypothetical protein
LLLPGSSLQEMYHDLAIFAADPEPGQLAKAIGAFLDGQTAGSERIRNDWQKRKDYFSWPRVAADYLKTLLS